MMNERIKELLKECSMEHPWMDHDDIVNHEKFAELIIKECIDIMDKERYNSTMLTSNPMQSGAICDAKWNIKNHFGVK